RGGMQNPLCLEMSGDAPGECAGTGHMGARGGRGGTRRPAPFRGGRGRAGSGKTSGGPPSGERTPAKFRGLETPLGQSDVLGLRALGALDGIEPDRLALGQLTVAGRLDVGVVREDVGAAAVLLDEAEALFRAEPLDRTGRHICSSLLY